MELLNEVNLRKINHENIYCHNTAILILVFAYRRGQLTYVVKHLRAMNKDTQSSKSLLTKFYELLWFWSEYYTNQGRGDQFRILRDVLDLMTKAQTRSIL